MARSLKTDPTQIPLSSITKVTFFKWDQITTDLICCEVEAAGITTVWHEEAEEWPALIGLLATLPGFHQDWLSAVGQQAFVENRTVAFIRL